MKHQDKKDAETSCHNKLLEKAEAGVSCVSVLDQLPGKAGTTKLAEDARILHRDNDDQSSRDDGNEDDSDDGDSDNLSRGSEQLRQSKNHHLTKWHLFNVHDGDDNYDDDGNGDDGDDAGTMLGW